MKIIYFLVVLSIAQSASANKSESCSGLLNPVSAVVRGDYSVSDGGKVTLPKNGYTYSLEGNTYKFDRGFLNNNMPRMNRIKFLTEIMLDDQKQVAQISYTDSAPPTGHRNFTAFLRYNNGRCYVEKIVEQTRGSQIVAAYAPLCQELQGELKSPNPNEPKIKEILEKYKVSRPYYGGFQAPKSESPVDLAKYHLAGCSRESSVSTALKDNSISMALTATPSGQPSGTIAPAAK